MLRACARREALSTGKRDLVLPRSTEIFPQELSFPTLKQMQQLAIFAKDRGGGLTRGELGIAVRLVRYKDVSGLARTGWRCPAAVPFVIARV